MTDFDKYYEATEPGYRERTIGWATAIGGLHRRDVGIKAGDVGINRDDVVINVVIKLSRGNSRISAAGIAKEAGLSARQVQRLLAVLKKNAGLKRRGSRKTGEWYFES